MRNAIKVAGEQVEINTWLFQRIAIMNHSDEDLEKFSSYELRSSNLVNILYTKRDILVCTQYLSLMIMKWHENHLIQKAFEPSDE